MGFFLLVFPDLCSLWSCGQFHEGLLGIAVFRGEHQCKSQGKPGSCASFFSIERAANVVWRGAECLAVWLLGTATEPADLICS